MPKDAARAETISPEPLAGMQSAAAALLGTAAVTMQPNGQAAVPLMAVGAFYSALAAFPAGTRWLLDTASEVARSAIESGRTATARRYGMGMAAFPAPGTAPAALVVFTTSSPGQDVSLLAAELGLPAAAIPSKVVRLDPEHVASALRFIEQAMALAVGARPASAADVAARRYRVLYSASQMLARAVGEEEVLRVAAEAITGILHMDNGVPYRFRSGEWRPGDGVSYWGEPHHVKNLLRLDEPREAELSSGRIIVDIDAGFRRILVPVLFEGADGRALDAIIALESARAPRPPLAVEEDFALLVARQAGVALRAARDAAIQSRLARTLQETLQSHFGGDNLPHTEVQDLYRPAAQDSRVGGDFFDVYTLSDGRVVVLIGDVAGKGLDSAIHTTLARYTLRAYALMTSDPAEILRLCNQALAQFREFQDFLTLALAVLDPLAGRLAFASAGHCPVYLYRHGADAIGSLDSTGTVLGMMPDLAWTSEIHKWEPGDMLLFYTDGISEAHPPGSFELFDSTRIRDLFTANRHATPRDILTAVFAAAEEYAEGAMHDDCAMLLVTHRGHQ